MILIKCLFILGGGGVGKSYLISILSKWVEYILRKSGDQPFSPKCLLIAPTGIASCLIGEFWIENSSQTQTISLQVYLPQDVVYLLWYETSLSC